jgi:hypothetical protein
VIPPNPLPAMLLMTPARYYHPRLFKLIDEPETVIADIHAFLDA